MIDLCDDLTPDCDSAREDGRKRESAADQCAADGDEIAARNAIAKAAITMRLPKNGEHDRVLIRRVGVVGGGRIILCQGLDQRQLE